MTYNDWYLPSWYEFTELCKQAALVKGFLNYYYWTSTENGPFDALTI